MRKTVLYVTLQKNSTFRIQHGLTDINVHFHYQMKYDIHKNLTEALWNAGTEIKESKQ